MSKPLNYVPPTMELLSLTAEPFTLDDGLDVSGDADDVMPLADKSGSWTPWY